MLWRGACEHQIFAITVQLLRGLSDARSSIRRWTEIGDGDQSGNLKTVISNMIWENEPGRQRYK